MLSGNADVIVNVIDANNLERSLYLTTQLLELNIPVILAINMLDVAKKRGVTIDLNKLAKNLGCPAVGVIATKEEGIDELKNTIVSMSSSRKRGSKKNKVDSRLRGNDKSSGNDLIQYPAEIKQAISFLTNKIDNKEAYFLSIRLLEDDNLARQKVSAEILQQVKKYQQKISAKLHEDVDVLIADARYGIIHDLVKQVVTESVHIKTTITAAIDKIVLNRILGIPIFLAVMYLMFFFAVNIGGIVQDYFQKSSDVIFVSGFGHLLSSWQLPHFLIAILTTGLGKGINTTLTFIPVLTTMFLFLALLEATGYMARAGFVVDRVMCAIGLPGKSFVPMLIGFGCNVPAIMAARTLENKRDRILTIMMTPFMSCTARLAIYAVFTAAFFPKGRQNIVFALYVIGILVAILTGLILRKTILTGRQSSLVMELPTYHLPTIRDVLFQTWCRLKAFICKAGKVIIPACIIIAMLNNIHINNKDSLLATAGHKVTPILKPIGIEQDNWPATVGLVTGVIAKEVVIATLNTLYKAHNGIYGQMYERFDGKAAAFAYLLFVLLYFPCIPALATILQELGWRWATFSMLWNTGIAYCTATVFYQIATFTEHPMYAGISLSAIIIAFLSVVLTMRWLSKKEES
jgi:ferrous iron transport protein B